MPKIVRCENHLLISAAKREAAIGCLAGVLVGWAWVILTATVFDVDKQTQVLLVLAAVIVTELALWVGGTLLGVTAVQKIRQALRLRPGRNST